MPTTEAYITPRLVRWARERSYPTVELAAERINVSAAKLDAWEHGESYPSFPQAVNLARRLNVPFGYLYLEQPPEEHLPLPDLRTVSGSHPQKLSPEFLDVLYDALRKQEWFKGYLQEDNAEPLPFVGRYNGASPFTVATDMRNTLGINQAFRQQVGSWEHFLTMFVQRAEQARILVLRSSYAGSNTRRHLDVEEFRGFAISDSLAPLVFINSRDAKAAQIFTLAHELAHLWVGQSGVSNLDYTEPSGHQRDGTDRHCDNIAAELLVPANDLNIVWNDSWSIDDNLYELVRRYRVSSFVVLRRAYDLGRIETAMYRTKYQALLKESAKAAGGKGGTFYPTFLARNSTTFTTALVVAAAEGRVTPKEAAALLNVRIATLTRVEQHVLSSGTAGA